MLVSSLFFSLILLNDGGFRVFIFYFNLLDGVV